MNSTEKLKIAMKKLEVNQIELAGRMKQTQVNISKKMKINNFRINDYEKLVNALGCTLEVNIIMPNGEKI